MDFIGSPELLPTTRPHGNVRAMLSKSLFVLATAFIGSAFGANNFHGLTVANSLGGVGSYTCRTQAQWNQVANDARNNGFKSIRILGFDCNALDMASSAAAAAGIQVFAGIYISGSVGNSITQINNEVQLFRAAHQKYGAGRFAGLTVGNEVNDSTGAIMTKVYDVRGYLNSIGINTPVSTVHTWVRIRDEPALCGADFVGANAHAFYDGQRTSDQTGDFIFNVVIPSLKRACPGKKIHITESGWPSRGGSFGRAIASTNDARSALGSLNCACKNDRNVAVYAFEYDDQVWKGNDNERTFGINGISDAVRNC